MHTTTTRRQYNSHWFVEPPESVQEPTFCPARERWAQRERELLGTRAFLHQHNCMQQNVWPITTSLHSQLANRYTDRKLNFQSVVHHHGTGVDSALPGERVYIHSRNVSSRLNLLACLRASPLMPASWRSRYDMSRRRVYPTNGVARKDRLMGKWSARPA